MDRRHSTLQNTLEVTIIVVFVGCYLVFMLGSCRKLSSVPKSMKLTEIGNQQSTSSIFVCPKGEGLTFVVGVPYSAEFAGRLNVKIATKMLTEMRFDSSSSQACNWLARQGLNGYILRQSPTGKHVDLDSILQTDKEYSLQIEFERLPPNGSSLWLWFDSGTKHTKK